MNKQLTLQNKINQTVPFIPLDDKHHCYQAAEIVTNEEIIDMAKYLIATSMDRPQAFQSVDDAKEYALIHCASHERETLTVLFLDGKHQLIIHDDMFYGTVNGAVVSVREIVKASLMHNAAAIILIHNHPSGDSSPSNTDIGLTKRVKDALNLIDIHLLDHLVVGNKEVHSMAREGDLV